MHEIEILPVFEFEVVGYWNARQGLRVYVVKGVEESKGVGVYIGPNGACPQGQIAGFTRL